LRSLSTGDYKVICRNPTPETPVDTIELYDIVTDPGELSNLAESPDSQGVLAEMLDVLESIGCPSLGEVEAPPTVDEELRNRLRAVGYL
jgi:arylsulfatase A-like enzyme